MDEEGGDVRRDEVRVVRLERGEVLRDEHLRRGERSLRTGPWDAGGRGRGAGGEAAERAREEADAAAEKLGKQGQAFSKSVAMGGARPPPVKRPNLAKTKLKKAFQAMYRLTDIDGDGAVTKREFIKAMPVMGIEVPEAEVDGMVRRGDIDHAIVLATLALWRAHQRA